MQHMKHWKAIIEDYNITWTEFAKMDKSLHNVSTKNEFEDAGLEL